MRLFYLCPSGLLAAGLTFAAAGATFAQDDAKPEAPAAEAPAAVEAPPATEAPPAAEPAPPVAPAQLPERPGGPGAPPLAPPPLGMFQMVLAIDADRDGVISKEEIAGAAEALAKLDKNEDGQLTRDEYLGAPGPGPLGAPPTNPGEQMVRGILSGLDKDGDEKISKEEAQGPLKENFDRLDGNKDGVLDREELVAVARFIGGAGTPPNLVTQQMVARLLEADKDGDGKISKEEAPERMKERFDEADANKDGFLDKEEVTAVVRRMASRRPGGQPPGAPRPRPAPDAPPADEKPAEPKPE